MTFQTVITSGEPGSLVPEPRRSVRRLMLATAMAAGTAADQQPGRHDRKLQNCLLLPQANLLIAGTGCRRPLLLREFASLCGNTGREGVIVRLGDDLDPGLATFDIKPLGTNDMLCAYRLWMSGRFNPGWLIPGAGERVYVRFDPDGLEFTPQSPFLDDADRARGLSHGHDFLSIAGKGWF